MRESDYYIIVLILILILIIILFGRSFLFIKKGLRSIAVDCIAVSDIHSFIHSFNYYTDRYAANGAQAESIIRPRSRSLPSRYIV